MAEAQVVLITGASSGFGKACAERLSSRGYCVFGTSRRTPMPVLPESVGAGLTMLPMDVTDDGSVERGVDAILQAVGRIDVVVNNAGDGIAGAVEDTSMDEARAQMETNFFGVLRVCQAVLPVMRAQRSGLVINISSLGGRLGIPFQALYSASKFAVEGLTEALRLEMRPFGVHAVLVEPGDACTGFTGHRRLVAGAAEESAYRERCQRALAVMEADERNGFPPEKLAAAVDKIIHSRRPRPRYVVASPMEAAAVGLKRLVPDGFFEWGLGKYYHAC